MWIATTCWAAAAMLALRWWMARCRELRRQRAAAVAKLDGRREAHAIVAHALFVEFPLLSVGALDAALLRTFGVPSISRRLARTAQFRARAAAGKRYDDTDLLVRECVLHHVDSERGAAAVRRINYLHSLHPGIANAEFVYVLCLSIVCPVEWARRYGYREWTDHEKAAYYRVWHDIGLRMGLRDIPASFLEASDYVTRFEERHMVYAESNREVAEPAIEHLLLADVPSPLRGFARRLAYAFMDRRLRDALGYSSISMSRPEKLAIEFAARAAHWALWAWQGPFTRFFLPPRPLHRALFRIAPLGCPVANSSSGPFSVTHRRFLTVPSVYEHSGYEIEDLGPLHPGKLAPPFADNKMKKKMKKKEEEEEVIKKHEEKKEDDYDDDDDSEEEEELLLCPLEACSNKPWPLSLLKHLPPRAA